jgi:hypothetical protein
MDNEINIQSFRELFYYLSRAVISLQIDQQQQVFQDMCGALEEWNSATPEVLRKLMNEFEFELEEYCVECDKDISGTIEVGKRICKECSENPPHVDRTR